ncbi:uncharacterized protein LOC113337186 [Papaver somniferum]|uniref:uncharacterized protein LOC113337186 n=1 Tax=Papaver somniferum TaxID=3469 RepID=UPI000E6F843D|nr:uncharacterized protein LOC113337186 [Papaver somniferum]
MHEQGIVAGGTPDENEIYDEVLKRKLKIHHNRRLSDEEIKELFALLATKDDKIKHSLLEGYELAASNPEKIHVLDAMNLAISAWTIDVRTTRLANCFRHCKLRSTNNRSLYNLVEHTNSEITQDLQNLIEKLGYRNSMNGKDVLNYPEENEVTQLLTDEEIIENVMGTDKDVEKEDESSTIEPPSRNEAIKAAITFE